jgi:hypothetical protein
MKPQATIILLLGLSAAAGCDPAGPGASGVISLGDAVDTTGFQSLELRAFAAKYSPADFAAVGALPTNPSDFSTLAHWCYRSVWPMPLVFPYAYEVGGGMGTTDEKDWVLVAWLTHADHGVDHITSGEIYAKANFTIHECGWGFDGYCGTVGGLNLVLDQTQP